jgi:hypothetical protein
MLRWAESVASLIGRRGSGGHEKKGERDKKEGQAAVIARDGGEAVGDCSHSSRAHTGS